MPEIIAGGWIETNEERKNKNVLEKEILVNAVSL